MKKIVLFIIILAQFYSVDAQNDTVVYSFFSAGHTYGNPNAATHYGLHEPFVDFIPIINDYPKMELGFLTGDVVVSSTATYWDSAQIDIDKFDMPIYIAAGNHDMGQEFVNRFGDYYYSFNYQNDLFIVLTPGLDFWNISGPQLEFLEAILESQHAQVNQIFIFLHELIWWSPTNEYQDIMINWEPHYPGSTNYDNVVKPLLLSYSNQITIYAGDLGCTNAVSPFMYDHFDNIRLIGSGMGGGVRDNIIITDVYNDSVYYHLVAINGDDQNALGEIYDYSISATHTLQWVNLIDIYPNPSIHGFIQLRNKSEFDLDTQIFNLQGVLIYEGHIQKNSVLKMETIEMKPGIYFLQLHNDKQSFMKKIMIQ